MNPKTIYIAMAVNDAFVMPLLVTVRSACRNLSPGWRLHVFVFGFEIQNATRQWCEARLAELPVDVEWRTLDLSGVASYWPGIRREEEITNYYRLFLGDVLPESVTRLLYLDADLLVCGDLAGLWNQPFNGHPVQAVFDAYSPQLHTPRLVGLELAEGIRFTKETPYFNAGVMLIDLAAWREQRIGQRAAELLWKHGSRFTGRDQDALNVALIGQWKRLPPKWNSHELSHLPDTWHAGGASDAEVREARAHPAIIHYIGEKPWSPAWRPHRSAQWWEEARRAGIPEGHRIGHVAIWEALLLGPHTRLLGHSCHREWGRMPKLILTRPWIVATYPVWLDGAALHWSLIYTLVCTNTDPFIHWQCELLEYTWKRAEQPGQLVRLVTAEPDQPLPRHRHAQVLRVPPQPDRDLGYVAFQRLLAMEHWLQQERPEGTVLIIDPDVVFRRAIPDEAQPGAPRAQHWLDYRPSSGSVQAATWPMLIHTSDLARLLPRWIDFVSAIYPRTNRWESDMEGLVAAAATLPLKFSLEPIGAFVGWPDEQVGSAPLVHYCQKVLGEDGEVLWWKGDYRPWDPVPDGRTAKHAYCRDLLDLINEYAATRSGS